MKFIFVIIMAVLVLVAYAAPNDFNPNKHGGSSWNHGESESNEHSHGSSHNLPGSKAVVGGKHWEHNSGHENGQQPANPVRKIFLEGSEVSYDDNVLNFNF